MAPTNTGREAPVSSMPIFLCRIGWFLLAPLAIFATGIGIGIAESAAFSTRDVFFGCFVLLAILLRWGSYWSGDRLDAFGEATATSRSIQKYSRRMILGAASFWVIVKAVALL